MKTHDLHAPEGATHRRKRIGRGIAAGQGKTGGFGTKGQGARSGRGGKLAHEGGQLPLVNRLPLKRGFRNVNRVVYSVVNVKDLNIFDAGQVVDPEALVAAGLVRMLRLLSRYWQGALDQPLTVKANKFWIGQGQDRSRWRDGRNAVKKLTGCRWQRDTDWRNAATSSCKCIKLPDCAKDRLYAGVW